MKPIDSVIIEIIILRQKTLATFYNRIKHICRILAIVLKKVSFPHKIVTFELICSIIGSNQCNVQLLALKFCQNVKKCVREMYWPTSRRNSLTDTYKVRAIEQIIVWTLERTLHWLSTYRCPLLNKSNLHMKFILYLAFN